MNLHIQSGPVTIPVPTPACPPVADSLGRRGSLEVRLANGAREIRRAQRLRYRVFFEEGSASPSRLAALLRRDVDIYDAACDHMVVLDHDVATKPFRAPKPKVVGTYRLLRQEVAERGAGFYAATEFDLSPLLSRRADLRFLELGRSCVARPYRDRKTVELLWQGIWAYALRHGADALIGCASLDGTEPDRLAVPLGFLHHHAASPAEWRVAALPDRHIPMDRLGPGEIEPKAAMRSLPPLVKAYLRAGATFGDGAVVDRAFGTTDVFVVMPIRAISARYIHYFGPAANRYPA